MRKINSYFLTLLLAGLMSMTAVHAACLCPAEAEVRLHDCCQTESTAEPTPAEGCQHHAFSAVDNQIDPILLSAEYHFDQDKLGLNQFVSITDFSDHRMVRESRTKDSLARYSPETPLYLLKETFLT